MATLTLGLSGLKALPKRLKIVGLVLLAELTVLAAGYLLLDDMMADRVGEVSGLRVTLQQLKRRNEQSRLDLARYPEMKQHYDQAMAAGIALPFDGRTVVSAAKDLGDRYRISNVLFKLGPMEGLKPVSTPRLVIENNEAEFKFGAVLDGDVRNFWRDLTASEPGHFRVIAFELERQHDLDDVTLTGFRRGAYSPLLQGRLDLLWTGVQPNLQAGGGS